MNLIIHNIAANFMFSDHPLQVLHTEFHTVYSFISSYHFIQHHLSPRSAPKSYLRWRKCIQSERRLYGCPNLTAKKFRNFFFSSWLRRDGWKCLMSPSLLLSRGVLETEQLFADWKLIFVHLSNDSIWNSYYIGLDNLSRITTINIVPRPAQEFKYSILTSTRV